MPDPRDQRIAELEAENERLRAELARRDADGRRRAAQAGYQAKRLAAKARGDWQPYADAGPVRDHIRDVMAGTGMSRYQFAAAAGIDSGTISKILYDGRPKVKTGTAEKILACTAAPEGLDGHADPAGTRRRLQALACLGWSPKLLAGRLSWYPGTVRDLRDGTTIRTTTQMARQVRDLYDTLETVPAPETTRSERISVAKTRGEAGRRGFAPAGAWGDDIDDPAAEPHWEWIRQPGEDPGLSDRGYRRHGESAKLAEDIRDLMRLGGESLELAARHVDVDDAQARELLRRYPEHNEDEEAA